MNFEKHEVGGFASLKELADVISSIPPANRLKIAETAAQRFSEFFGSPKFLRELSDGMYDIADKKEGKPTKPLSDNQYLRTRHAIFKKLKGNNQLNATDKEWLRRLLKGHYKHLELSKLPKLGSDPFMIMVLVDVITSFGFSKFRNETTPPVSATDIVAKINLILGWGPTSYSRVKAIYLSFGETNKVD